MNRLKHFLSPARDAREAYLAGLQRGARRPSASDLVALALALVCIWLCLAGLVYWMCDTLLDDRAFIAFVGIVFIFCLRKAIYVTVLLAHVARAPSKA
jgi:hypothetical protein